MWTKKPSGYGLAHLARARQAVDHHAYEQAVELLDVVCKAPGINALAPTLMHQTWKERGRALIKQSDLGEAQRSYSLALKEAQRISHALTSLRQEIAVYGKLGFVLCTRGAFVQGIAYLNKAHSLAQEHFPIGNKERLRGYNNLGEAHRKSQQYKQAISYFKEGILEAACQAANPLSAASDRDEHPMLAWLHQNLALAYAELGSRPPCRENRTTLFVLSAQHYQVAKDLDEPGESKDLAQAARRATDLGAVDTRQGKYDMAEACFQEALAYNQQLGDMGSLSVAKLPLNGGNSCIDQGRFVEATQALEKGLEILVSLGVVGQQQRPFITEQVSMCRKLVPGGCQKRVVAFRPLTLRCPLLNAHPILGGAYAAPSSHADGVLSPWVPMPTGIGIGQRFTPRLCPGRISPGHLLGEACSMGARIMGQATNTSACPQGRGEYFHCVA